MAIKDTRKLCIIQVSTDLVSFFFQKNCEIKQELFISEVNYKIHTPLVLKSFIH